MSEPASQPISPELVLVDPGLRARIAELPTGPVFSARVSTIPAEPVPAPNPVFGRAAAGAAVLLLFLALPLLALASDLVRKQPRLEPTRPARSGLVHVGAQQHVVPDLPRSEPGQPQRGN